jgi:serine/threonine-protein kinase HipA
LRPEDTFGLLREVGWECAGAVAILPEGREPADGRYRPVSPTELGARLDSLPSIADLPDSEVRMSLGGAQDKLLVARDGDADWLLTIDGAPSTHILKPEPERWPGLAMAEAWALTVAASATSASQVEVSRALGSRPVLVVTRYDRESSGTTGMIRRLHQEDLCQAIGSPPSAKYAPRPPRPESPSLAKLARILLARADDPPVELERLLAQVAVSVALRNADLHGKNLSIINRRGVVRLAPIYDVAPTTAFLEHQISIGLPVGATYKLTEIGAKHLVLEAVTWGLPERRAREVLSSVVEDLQRGIVVADERWPEVIEQARQQALAGIFAISLEEPGRHQATPPGRSKAGGGT